MPLTRNDENDSADDLLPEDDDGPADWEDPDESDMDSDDGDEIAETEPCPYCRKPLYEQAEVCPHCGSYISYEDAPRHYPLWIVLGVAASLLAVLVWVLCRA